MALAIAGRARASMNPNPAPPSAVPPAVKQRLADLRAQWGEASGADLLKAMLAEFSGEIAVSSSFGTESAVLLHLIAGIDPHTPVIFLNTGKLFPETLRYRDLLQERLGLTDLRAVGPDPADRLKLDPEGKLWRLNPDACCHFRKTLPLERALTNFSALITGRKRFQTAARAHIPAIELSAKTGSAQGYRFVINPLARWTQSDLEEYIKEHNLPSHSLRAQGYLSIGCMPCTERVSEGQDYRAGRWAGQDKEECGIHDPVLQDGEGI